MDCWAVLISSSFSATSRILREEPFSAGVNLCLPKMLRTIQLWSAMVVVAFTAAAPPQPTPDQLLFQYMEMGALVCYNMATTNHSQGCAAHTVPPSETFNEVPSAAGGFQAPSLCIRAQMDQPTPSAPRCARPTSLSFTHA